jgi:hypothetical protein
MKCFEQIKYESQKYEVSKGVATCKFCKKKYKFVHDDDCSNNWIPRETIKLELIEKENKK